MDLVRLNLSVLLFSNGMIFFFYNKSALAAAAAKNQRAGHAYDLCCSARFSDI
jgi:hypothetical protein